MAPSHFRLPPCRFDRGASVENDYYGHSECGSRGQELARILSLNVDHQIRLGCKDVLTRTFVETSYYVSKSGSLLRRAADVSSVVTLLPFDHHLTLSNGQ